MCIAEPIPESVNLQTYTGDQNPNMEKTGCPGRAKGQLGNLAKLATKSTLDRKLLVNLRNNKVGTKKMELEAIRLSYEAEKTRGVMKIGDGKK